MKMISRMLMTAVAVAALAAPAMAADKLIVQNAAGTANVFKVDDTGYVTATGANFGTGIITGAGMVFNNTLKRFGYGTTNPLTAMQITTDEPDSGNASRGLTLAQHGTNVAASVIAINRSRGTEAIPSNLAQGDNIAAFHAKPYDALNLAGNWYMPTATFAFMVDGATSNGVAPTAMQFFTGSNAATRTEKFRIASDGRLRISNQPAAPASTTACTIGDLIFDVASGYLYLCSSATSPYWKRATFAAY